MSNNVLTTKSFIVNNLGRSDENPARSGWCIHDTFEATGFEVIALLSEKPGEDEKLEITPKNGVNVQVKDLFKLAATFLAKSENQYLDHCQPSSKLKNNHDEMESLRRELDEARDNVSKATMRLISQTEALHEAQSQAGHLQTLHHSLLSDSCMIKDIVLKQALSIGLSTPYPIKKLKDDIGEILKIFDGNRSAYEPVDFTSASKPNISQKRN